MLTIRFFYRSSTELIEDAGALQNALLQGAQDFLDDLADLGLHLEPLELLDFEF